MHLDARKVVLSLVMFSNIGGAATGIGDPPNVLIINSPYFKNVRDISYRAYYYLFLLMLLTLFVTSLIIHIA